MRKCPKCKKWELDVFPTMDSYEAEDYYFRCWNCDFWCSKTEGQKYPSEAIILIRKKKEKNEINQTNN